MTPQNEGPAPKFHHFTGRLLAASIGACLQPGVTVTGDLLQFPDEDFEHFLRNRLSEADLREAHNRLADHYLARRDTNPEAASNVADHLKEAGRDDELIALALEEPIPLALEDGLARALAGRRRLTLAIDASARVNAVEQSAQLVFLAAQVTRSDTSLTNVIRARPDLAARFADSEAVATLYLVVLGFGAALVALLGPLAMYPIVVFMASASAGCGSPDAPAGTGTTRTKTHTFLR